MSALQTGASGTQACINASSVISGIIADLDTTVMFASTGMLDAEPGESFSDHKYVSAFFTCFRNFLI